MLKPALPPYEVEAWKAWPFPARLKAACQAWAVQGYGSPLAVVFLYLAKIAVWMAIWAWLCTFTPGNTLGNPETWWASKIAFEKLVVWTLLFEGLGLGCGSGPLTGRYLPPIGGCLYFLRPGTLKRPLFPALPVIGASSRGLLDVAAYALTVGIATLTLVSPVVTTAHLGALIVAICALGVLDKTLFLVFRSEHYVSAMVCLLFADDWIAGNKVVWLAIWWWAAFSKLTHHFPAVMCVMNSNAPWTRWGPLRKRLYRDFPDDLRPSRAAVVFAHLGTVVEFAIPAFLVLGDGGMLTLVALGCVTVFHLFIVANVPAAVPLEWNFVMIYGAWVLFGVHADVSPLAVGAPLLVAWLVGFHLLLPLYASAVPSQASFLVAMRYYAGNWAYSVWLFREGSDEKLDQHLVKSSSLPRRQLARLYDDDTVTALLSKVMAFRAMHLHGRALQFLLPRAVDDLDQRTWYDGELVAGLALGWNFGDGHLHDEQLLSGIQERCGFAPGELRCIFVESQPLFRSTLAYRIVDAATGECERGEIEVGRLREVLPWPTPS